MRHDTATLVLLLAAVAVVAWFSPDVPLVVFAGCLLAVALRAAADPLSRFFGIATHWCVLLVALVTAVVFGVGAWLSFASLAEQARQFAEAVPRVLQRLAATAEGLPGSDWLRQQVSPEAMQPAAQTAASMAWAGVSGTLGALGNLVLGVLLGLYIASDPALYRRGALALLSPGLRPRGEATLNAMAHQLRGWLLGQMCGMVFLGAVVFAGLWALGIPLAALLAVLTGLFNFIPYVGPVLGAVPAVLIAASHDTSTVLWVVALFVAAQTVESYVVTPMVQQQAADVPPALLLGSQVLFGSGLGFMGLLLAAPITAAAMAAIRVSYVEGWVEDPSDQDERRIIRP